MALIIPAGYAQVTIPFNHVGVAREAVCTFGVDSSDYAGDFTDLANDIQSTWMATFGQEQDSNVTIGPVRLAVGQDGGDPLSVSGTVSNVGGRGMAALPSNVALLIQKRSLTGGRKGRGRMFIPWILQDIEADDVGQVDGTALAAFQVHASALRSRLNAGTGITAAAPMHILHDSSGIGTEPPPSEVTTLIVDPLIATQRRRLAR